VLLYDGEETVTRFLVLASFNKVEVVAEDGRGGEGQERGLQRRWASGLQCRATLVLARSYVTRWTYSNRRPVSRLMATPNGDGAGEGRHGRRQRITLSKRRRAAERSGKRSGGNTAQQ